MSRYPLAEMFTLTLHGAPHTTALLTCPVNTMYNTRHKQWACFWSVVYRTTWVVIWQGILRTIRTATLWLMTFQIFSLSCCKELCSLLHRSPFWSGFLAQTLLEIVKHPVHCLPCLWNFGCPDTDNGPLFSVVICSYLLMVPVT